MTEAPITRVGREALDALSELDLLINMVGSGEYITSNRKRLHLSNLNQRAVDAVRALAATPPETRIACCPHCGEELSTAPPEPRWPSRDELAKALDDLVLCVEDYMERNMNAAQDAFYSSAMAASAKRARAIVT